MKSSAQPSLLSTNLESSKSVQGQSPYLKAILTGKILSARNEKYYESSDTDRAAASRYIKESRLTHKH